MNIQATDLALVLALTRGKTLVAAGRRLGQDPSTIFRAVRRLEARLGRTLFARSRRGFDPLPLALDLAAAAERIEGEIAFAGSLVGGEPVDVAGPVRVTTTDVVLHDRILPLLGAMRAAFPRIVVEFDVANRFVDLTRRDADIAIRPTSDPPDHLIGRRLCSIGAAVCSTRAYLSAHPGVADDPGAAHWITPDGSLADHPHVRWRERVMPQVRPVYGFGTMMSLIAAVRSGAGVAVLPELVGDLRTDLVALGPPISELTVELWLLQHRGSRDVPHIAAAANFFAGHLRRDASPRPA